MTVRYPIGELTQAEQDDLERKLVWVFGSPRSGTSWLAMQLLSYRTYCMNEPFIGRHIGHIAYEVRDNVTRDLELSGPRHDYFFSKKYAPAWRPLLRKFILGRVHAQYHDFKSKKTVIIKEPNGSIASDVIGKCLTRSKIIVIVRDGRDIIDSQIDAIQKGGWGTKWSSELSPVDRPNFVIRQAKYWNVVMEIMLETYRKHPSSLRVLLKYEDLRTDTFDVTSKLYNFIGIPITDKKLNSIVEKYKFENIPDAKKGSGKVVRAASPGLWEKSFTSEEKETMWKIMGRTLQRLGYSR